jgi:hypothetical protein
MMYYLKHPNALMVDGNKSRASKRMLWLPLENDLLPHDLLNLLNNRGRSTFHIVEPHPASESNLAVTLELDLPAKAFIDPIHKHLLRTAFFGAPFGFLPVENNIRVSQLCKTVSSLRDLLEL